MKGDKEYLYMRVDRWESQSQVDKDMQKKLYEGWKSEMREEGKYKNK